MTVEQQQYLRMARTCGTRAVKAMAVACRTSGLRGHRAADRAYHNAVWAARFAAQARPSLRPKG